MIKRFNVYGEDDYHCCIVSGDTEGDFVKYDDIKHLLKQSNNDDNYVKKELRLQFQKEKKCNPVYSTTKYLEWLEQKLTSHNSDYKTTFKFPSLDDAYKEIPFPDNEKEHSFFVAGLVEMYKYLRSKLDNFS